jgi:hypothetical protein
VVKNRFRVFGVSWLKLLRLRVPALKNFPGTKPVQLPLNDESLKAGSRKQQITKESCRDFVGRGIHAASLSNANRVLKRLKPRSHAKSGHYSKKRSRAG